MLSCPRSTRILLLFFLPKEECFYLGWHVFWKEGRRQAIWVIWWCILWLISFILVTPQRFVHTPAKYWWAGLPIYLHSPLSKQDGVTSSERSAPAHHAAPFSWANADCISLTPSHVTLQGTGRRLVEENNFNTGNKNNVKIYSINIRNLYKIQII